MTIEFLRIQVVGDNGVGKRALITRACSGYFIDHFDGYDPSYRRLKKWQDETYVFNFLPIDTRVEYQALVQMHLKTGDGFIILYSVTDRASFESVKTYHEQIVDVSAPVSPIYLVANKCDMKEERVVSEDEGRTLAKELQCRFREVSAKDDVDGVNEMYESTAISVIMMRRARVFFPDRQPPFWKRALRLDHTMSWTAAKRWLEGSWY